MAARFPMFRAARVAVVARIKQKEIINHHTMIQTRQTQFTPRRAAAYQGGMRRNQNATKFRSETKLGPVAHTVLVALMVTVLGLIYLTQATKTTAYSYQAQTLDSEMSELEARKSELEVQNARLTALEKVKSSSVASAMTTPESTQFAQ